MNLSVLRMLIFMLFWITIWAPVVASENPAVVYKNNKAIDIFNEEKTLESKVHLQRETVNYPKSAELHYNLGFIHENSKEPKKAIEEYLSSSAITDNKDLKFQAYFNAARVYGEQKDIPNALKYYQAALEIRPDSLEVKTNIEMLLKNGGGGGGNSNQDQKSEQQEQKKQQQKQDQPKQADQPKNDSGKKPAPKPFDSKELSEQDVKNILNELKRQEEQIRAKMNNQKSKETPVGKDW